MVDVITDLYYEDARLAETLVEANNCQMVGLVRASEYEEDHHLYYVIAISKDGTYVSWCMNTSTKCLNHGHYGYETHLACLKDVLNNRVTTVIN